MASKPPLGVVPKWVRQEERLEEIAEAILRFRKAGETIPMEWILELREIAQDLLNR